MNAPAAIPARVLAVVAPVIVAGAAAVGFALYRYAEVPRSASDLAALFGLLQAGRIGMQVTESYAMLPAASVSGFYLAHPEATYFAVGKIGEDQLSDFARRAGETDDALRRSLAPSLA